VGAEEIHVLIFVAGGDEFFQPQILEAVAEIMKEVGNSGIIAVAENGFAFKVVAVMFQFVFYISKLGIELVFFVAFCAVQVFVEGFCHPQI